MNEADEALFLKLTHQREALLLAQFEKGFFSLLNSGVGWNASGVSGHVCLRGKGSELESLDELNQGEAVLIKQAAACRPFTGTS